MKLHPHALVVGIDQAEGMATESMHMTIRVGSTAIAHQEHYLVKAFRIMAPEIPLHGRAFTIGIWIALLCMDKIAEFLRVFYKEDRRIVTYQVPVAVFGIKFNSKSTRVSF